VYSAYQHMTNSKRIFRWLVDCVMHPDMEGDRTVLWELGFYSDGTSWLTPIESDYHEQVDWHRKHPLDGLPGITRFFADSMRRNPTLETDDFLDKIGHFCRLVMNAVDVWLFHLKHPQSTPDAQDIIIEEGEEVLQNLWSLAIHDPFSTTPEHIQNLLSNILGMCQFLLNDVVPFLSFNEKTLHVLAATFLFNHVGRAIGDLGADPGEEIEVATLAILQRDFSNMSRPRPLTLPDEVTAGLDARIRQGYDTEPTIDVPVELTGARIEPRNLSETFSDPPADERCPVCQCGYADHEDECVKLNACGHLLPQLSTINPD
jgi:hypothetical protein